MWRPRLNKYAVLFGALFLIFYPLGTLAENWLLSKGIYPYIGGRGTTVSVGVLIALALALAAHVIIQKHRKK